MSTISSKAKTKTKTKTKVFVVRGFVDYEGSDVIAVCSSRIVANTAIQSHQTLRKVEGRWDYDGYDVLELLLDEVKL